MIYVFLAQGFEECEALIPIDIMRRAGIKVKTVGVNDKTIIGAHAIPVVCDETTETITTDNLTGILLPGGMPGTLNLENSAVVQKYIDYSHKNNLLISAICAAPSILGHKGLLNGKTATCFPGYEKDLKGAVISDAKSVTDGNIITACGVGAAFDFGYQLVDYITGDPNQSHTLAKQMLYK